MNILRCSIVFAGIQNIGGEKMINMDSQIPNHVVKEWLEAGHLFEGITCIRPEKTYKNSRFDIYAALRRISF